MAYSSMDTTVTTTNTTEGKLEDGVVLNWIPDEKYLAEKTDLIIVVNHCHFNVHKHKLEASADYFRAMFASGMKENETTSITLDFLDAEPFQTIVESFYSGTMDLTQDNVFSVVEMASFLQLVPDLLEQCKSYLKRLISPQLCFDVMYLCDSINLIDVYSEAKRYCLGHFSQLKLSEDFLDLTCAQVFDYLSDSSLVVENEFDVLQAIQHWFKRKKLTAEEDIPEDFLKELLSKSLHFKGGKDGIESLVALVTDEREVEKKDVIDLLVQRKSPEDVLMFWSVLETPTPSGLVHVVRMNKETCQASKCDTMTDIVTSPGYDLGSAVCSHGCCVYMSGGGPSFGKMNWIRKMYMFDSSKSENRWQVLGDLYETRRHHGMVAIGVKLYLFGGFGKYRAKNIKMDCFDIVDGTWTSLPKVPVHVTKPVAASTDTCILLMQQETSNMHCFDIRTQNWTLITKPPELTWGRYNYFDAENETYSHPLSMHICKDRPNHCFVIVCGHEKIFVFTVRFDLHSNKWEIVSRLPIGTTDNYEGSVMANDRLFILLGMGDHEVFGEQEVHYSFSPVKEIVTFCTRTKTVINRRETNVRKVLNIATVPHLPATFPTAACRQQSLKER